MNRFFRTHSFSIIIIFLFFSVFVTQAANEPVTRFLTNLSQGLLPAESNDYSPEMVIEGNTIHACWSSRVGNDEGYLFYSRSADLGATWEPARQIYRFKDGNLTSNYYSRRLAVSGNQVFIGVADYDYANNGTGYLYLFRSSDGGATFQAPLEVDKSGGGYSRLNTSYLRVSGNRVAFVYRTANYNDATIGVYCAWSADGGATFQKTTITNSTNNITDFWYDGSLMVVLHDYTYYYYGLNRGLVYASVSADHGATFTTTKISVVYGDNQERCYSSHDNRYGPKIAVDGNNIHIIFTGNNEQGVWSVLYARSADKGATFDKTVDINAGKIANIQNGHETVVARGGNLYMAYLSTGSKVYLVRSDDGGATLSAPEDLLTATTTYLQTTWYPQLVLDPADTSGKTLFFAGGTMMSRRSDDGGLTFSDTRYLAPFLTTWVDIQASALAVDGSGSLHWLSRGKWLSGDFDILYGREKPQPAPGSVNKALRIETVLFGKVETVVVPSSPTLAFDSAMTGEAWVKIRNGGSRISLFAKVNDQEGDDYQPSGFNMGFRPDAGKFCLNAGLKTSQGGFVNWGSCTVGDTLWHHVAFTYDVNAGLNNFKAYADGILVAQQTVTGNIIPGDGMLLIGSRVINYTDDYLVDDIRLWNRALGQEELLQNQTRTFTGNEEGLALWLNFDDTFRDLSGNGNDAIPVYLGELQTSDLDPPLPAFDLYKSMNQVSLTNKTVNGTGYLWDFGNGKTSEQANPVVVYPTPGEYAVTLVARNSNSVTAQTGKVTIEGLAYVEPVKAGNQGYVKIQVQGGGLSVEGTSFLLRRSGSPDIAGQPLYSPAPGILAAQFLLEDAAQGKWDVVVKKGGAEQVLPEAFEVVPAERADPWVTVGGRGAILFNMWQTYTLTFGNNGNVDAYGVPVWFAISDIPGMEIEFIDFRMEVPQLAIDKGYGDAIRDLGPYFTTETVLGEAFNARVYPFMVPLIAANSSMSIHIRVKTPQSFRMMVWANPPWVEFQEELLKSLAGEGQGAKVAAAQCVLGVIAEGLVDISTSAIPGVGCLWSSGKLIYQTGKSIANQKFSIWNTLWNSAVTFVDCGINLSGIGAIYKGVGVFMANMGGYAKSIRECNELAKANSKNGMSVGAVSSFDPNEMVGPAGYGPERWIQKQSFIPYTILFENKSEATAPAHIVTVTDTLDLAVYDLSGFGFGAFGWGDTTLFPIGTRQKEFSMDVDLRPALNLITRVSAKLDTLTGVARWEFLSLNPSTLGLEEDPMVGFLPPNKTSPEGEGFVSFTVGMKDHLKTNDLLKNKASIVFDANAPIVTGEFVNTLDTDKPESRVLPLEATTDSRFTVTWSGNDQGSGIGSYFVYVMENDTLLRPWKMYTKETAADFSGEVGSHYKFYSIASDNVSLNEEEPGGYDAFTTVTVNVKEFDLKKEQLQVYPNPAAGQLNVRFPGAPCGVYVVELRTISGQLFFSELREDHELSAGFAIPLQGVPHGPCVVRVVFGNRQASQLITVGP